MSSSLLTEVPPQLIGPVVLFESCRCQRFQYGACRLLWSSFQAEGFPDKIVATRVRSFAKGCGRLLKGDVNRLISGSKNNNLLAISLQKSGNQGCDFQKGRITIPVASSCTILFKVLNTKLKGGNA
uniref:Uncharacterized protein n=1 Tax=Photinus pyralis TaxID=7054 RepID=A0A1Y1LIV6_PHOPY